MKKKSYIIDNKLLMSEWDYEKNKDLDPNKLTYGSNKKAWWKCSKGHNYQKTIKAKNKSSKCPICFNISILSGYNDLETLRPLIAEQWHPTKNGSLKPNQVSLHSDKKIWWKCSKGHEYEMSIAKRVDGRNCPYCSNQKVLVGYNDLQTFYPEIAKEWHPTKNGNLKPNQVTPGSNRLIWWKCSKGHEYQALVHNRTTKHNNCPYCSGHRTFTGYNDLKTLYPNLAKEWNYEKNVDLKPEQFTPGSHEKVWWKCPKGHEYQMIINKRRAGDNCPYCSSHKFRSGYNDFTILYPDIAREWNYKKNNNLNPSQFFAKDKNKFWWTCSKCGSIWNASIRSRIQKVAKCPKCITENRKQFYLKKYGCITNPILLKEWNYEKNGGLKPEQFTPSSEKKVWWKCSKGHEYQQMISDRSKGSNCPICSNKRVLSGHNDLETLRPLIAKEWHPTKNGNLKPNQVSLHSNKKIWWKCSKGHEYQKTIDKRVNGQACPFCSNRKVLVGYNDLKTLYPNIAKEWNYEKNGDLKPEQFTWGSGQKIWWKCLKCGNEWKTAIRDRTKGTICPRCASIERGHKKHIYSLQKSGYINNPLLLEEWNYEKNGDLKPEQFTPGSNKSVWWKCSKCGSEWKARIGNRSILKRGCPYCANHRIVKVKATNSLAVKYPEIAKQWHPTKNGELTPKDVPPGTRKKVYWLCENNHEYQASILHRVHGTNCPICNSGRQTSFAEQATFYYVKKLYPDAISRYTADFLGRMELDIYIPSIKYAIEYDGEAWHKENKLEREQRKYKICQKHDIKLIRLREKKAPIGSNIADYIWSSENLYKHNNLKKVIKEVITFLNFSRKCDVDINIKRDRFEIQKYRQILKKDFFSQEYPKIAMEWHPTKNGSLTPNMFRSGSQHKVWWKCSKCGNEYEARIGSRTKGCGCPKCAIEKSTKAKRKAVNMIDINTNKIIKTFISISEASRQMKINSSNIGMVCKGQRPAAGGYCWSYSEKPKQK